MEDKVINISLTVQETNLVLGALGELPAKASMSIIQKIQAQAGSQMQAPEPEPVLDIEK